jgi:hypothetical protein
MGHLRLGRLPKTRAWGQVVNLLETNVDNIPKVGRATLKAAEAQLKRLSADPVVSYCFWLLTRVTWFARGDDFATRLTEIGVNPETASSAFTFISQLTDHVRAKAAEHPESGVFAEIASLSLRQALAQTVAEHSTTLFGTSLEDIQRACRLYSTRNQFGVLVKHFFAHFLSRSLQYLLNKELSNHIGPEHGLNDIESAKEFNDALVTYSRQSAKIIEDFAAGWYSKHNWESRGEIPQEDARRFVAMALRKLQMELQREEDLA